MDPVISMTKQGVRNLNNLGPKKKKVVAAEAQGEAGETGEQGQSSEQSAPQTAEAPAASE